MVLKLSGKRTTIGNISGETIACGHRRGKSANRERTIFQAEGKG